MNRLIELKLTFMLGEILNQSKRHNPGYVLLENDKYYLAMLVNTDNRQYKNDQIKFAFVRKNPDKTKYVLAISCQSLDLTTLGVISHIKQNFSNFLEDCILDISELNCSRIEFEKHYEAFYKKRLQLHSKEHLEFEKSKTIKPISSYEKQPDANVAHLVAPRNDKEKRMAILERETFCNPKMWRYKI